MKHSAPKGTFDIFPTPSQPKDIWKSSHLWSHVETVFQTIAKSFGFELINTPIFEKTDLFLRTVGDTSDIVSKEMYIFEDKASRSMALRPEGTAPVIRAFIENNLIQTGSLHKLFYFGPYFRYDRPQAGRYRQFHQFGVEAIGEKNPLQDIEIIDFCMQAYEKLGIKGLEILLNSVGDPKSRDRYKDALLKYLKPHFESLSDDSQTRFHKNPLRILDSKDPKDKELLKEAPSILDYLSKDSENHFQRVLDALNLLKIPYKLDQNLVRGLDYYNETVFEVTSNVLGAQSSIGAGGRYDGLIRNLGGQDLPSIGFATGLERVIQTMIGQKVALPEKDKPSFFFIPLDDKSSLFCFEILHVLRRQGLFVKMLLKQKKMQKALQEASESGAQFSVILGENELAKHAAQVKNMRTRESFEIPLNKLAVELAKLVH